MAHSLQHHNIVSFCFKKARSKIERLRRHFSSSKTSPACAMQNMMKQLQHLKLLQPRSINLMTQLSSDSKRTSGLAKTASTL